MARYLGVSKTLHDSSAALINVEDELIDIEIILTERLNKVKNSGAWPKEPLLKLANKYSFDQVIENSAVYLPEQREEILNLRFPFYEHLKIHGLDNFSSKFNPKIKFLNHHKSHAYAAALLSPFSESLIVVFDGAGQEYPPENGKRLWEYISVFHFKDGKINFLERQLTSLVFDKQTQRKTGDSIGIFYETIAKFIFNNSCESGKVMGLAPFGQPTEVKDYLSFLQQLDWDKAFKGGGKTVWEKSSENEKYLELAASAQNAFENFSLNFFTSLREKYPAYENLILTGGCALNCTANWKLFKNKIFSQIYIPPNPGDESIALGCAASELFQNHSKVWKPRKWEDQISFFGCKDSIATDHEIKDVFENYRIIECASQKYRLVADLLNEGKVLGWMRGRSECGPRALGHRSIIAKVDQPGLKSYLNQNIKFREEFRPYGCSVIWDDAHEYLEIPKEFHNPFMSYAMSVKSQWKERLKEVTHVDGTCRAQLLEEQQEPAFYSLLMQMKELTGLPMVLNTSLNIMNEPILEDIHDAKRFLDTSRIDGLVIEGFFITRLGS